MRIGVFDSGLGGLTVLDELIAVLPDNDFVYLGDNARAPYGNRPSSEVIDFTTQAVDFLAAQNCSVIIVACNTASSEALRVIQREVLPERLQKTKVLGVLIPSAEAVAEREFKKIGVIGTAGTINSGAYEREIKKISPEADVVTAACPNLAGLIEKGHFDGQLIIEELERCLAPIKSAGVEALILGCTHYPLVELEVKALLPDTEIINPPRLIARSFLKYLKRHQEIKDELGRFGMVQYFTTGSAKDFREYGQKFMEHQIDVVKQIRL